MKFICTFALQSRFWRNPETKNLIDNNEVPYGYQLRKRCNSRSLNGFAALRGTSPIQYFFLMQSEKTPHQLLQENYDFLTMSYETVRWLKSVYEQKTKIQNIEIELLKKGIKSEPAIAFIDFKKAEILMKPNFFELQMLN